MICIFSYKWLKNYSHKAENLISAGVLIRAGDWKKFHKLIREELIKNRVKFLGVRIKSRKGFPGSSFLSFEFPKTVSDFYGIVSVLALASLFPEFPIKA